MPLSLMGQGAYGEGGRTLMRALENSFLIPQVFMGQALEAHPLPDGV